MEGIIIPVVVAVVSGVVTGMVSSMGTVAALRIHIEYLRESVQKHDARLRTMEREVSVLASDLKRGRASLPDPLRSML